MTRRIYIVSPREPSGATWLINCFLELNIKTFRLRTYEKNSEHLNSEAMWKKEGEGYVLASYENILKKWLPVLTKREMFHFREDIEVVWTHAWPIKGFFEGHQIIYFARDPRDALYSAYKRENPDNSFQQFLEFPDFSTLLNRVEYWDLFNNTWLSQQNVRVFRFEDYKKDAETLLKAILEYIGLKIKPESFKSAIEGSSFEKAAQAEKKYVEQYGKPGEQLINRAGKPNAWQDLTGADRDSISFIEACLADSMRNLGYACNPDESIKVQDKCYPSVDYLKFFRDLAIPDDVFSDNRKNEQFKKASFELLIKINSLTAQQIKNMNISVSLARLLLESVSEFNRNFLFDLEDGISEIRKTVVGSHNKKTGRLSSMAKYFKKLYR